MWIIESIIVFGVIFPCVWIALLEFHDWLKSR